VVTQALGAFALVVVNFGSHALLADHLGTHTDAFTELNVSVVVVDNFSTPAELAAIRQAADRSGWELVESPVNLGFGAAVNLGAARARDLGCAGLLLLNPDAVISLDVLIALREHVARAPGEALAPRIVTPTGRVEFRGSRVRLADGRIQGLGPGLPTHRDPFVLNAAPVRDRSGPTQSWLSGACLAVSMELFERAGGFDESYFLYWEDLDLSRRIELAGGTLIVRDDLEVVHDEGGTQVLGGGRVRPDTYYYYNCRNRLTFAARNLDRAGILRWIWHTPRESWQILLRGGRRDVLGSPRPLLAAFRGSLAGLGVALRALVRPAAAQPVRSVPGGRPRVLVAHPGAELYGSDRMMLESVDGLVAAGIEVTVVVPTPGPLVDELARRGVRVTICAMPVLRKSALRPLGFARLLATALRGVVPAIRLIRRDGTAGVYVSTVTVPSWLILGRLLGRPVTCHVHEAERSAPRPVRKLLALPTRCAQRVVVNSEYSLDVLAEVAPGVRSRSQVVYNGVAGPDHAVPPRQELTGPIRLLYVGRLSPRKGPDVALAAARVLVSRGLDIQLELLGAVFAGYEWFEQQLRADSAAADLAGRVRFSGFDPDVWPRLAAADIVVVPSVVDEPFGNTAVEAALAARPAVVSDTSGLREAAAGYQAAVLVEPGDPRGLADAVERIVGDWSSYASWAETDSVQMRERYSPARYRAEIAACVLAAGTPR
jgi:GT2 family glycosyltransferase/glycosyltransferase involved in cell wall biosynthesis